ncbi:hypothetical protein ACFFWD_29430 [Bradyrhizobium erythrophlei]|uniref:hypothetical protein n=1 Tax=Bradyrhizobium erythrophlei TaxID=1437360 RepID=UPI0035EE810C
MLISIIARVESGRIAGNSLNLVQRGVWEDITAMTPDAMAEDLLAFTADRNGDFELGCRNAATFSLILFGAQSLVDGVGMDYAEQVRDPFEADFAQSHAQREDVSSAWRQFFDAHISESSSQGELHQFD